MWMHVLLIVGGTAVAWPLFKVGVLDAEVARLKGLRDEFNTLEHRFYMLVENRDEEHNGVDWKALREQALAERKTAAWLHDNVVVPMYADRGVEIPLWGPTVGDAPAENPDKTAPPTG